MSFQAHARFRPSVRPDTFTSLAGMMLFNLPTCITYQSELADRSRPEEFVGHDTNGANSGCRPIEKPSVLPSLDRQHNICEGDLYVLLWRSILSQSVIG